MIYDCIIVGGGAAGMCAAITLARSNKQVLLIEQCKELGKKLSVTGNGRCNFTNSYYEEDSYRGDPSFAKEVIKQRDHEATRSFFRSIGIMDQERDGYYYPYTNQARTVVNCFLSALQQEGVTVLADRIVRQVIRKKYGYHVITSYQDFDARAVLLACGGKASAFFKEESFGYRLAQDLGHTVTPLFPALCALYVKEDITALKGIRLTGAVTIYRDKERKHPVSPKKTGEIQFTRDTISGIPTFQVSRYAAQILAEQKVCYASVDFFPYMEKEALADWFCLKKDHSAWSKKELLRHCSGMLLDPVAELLVSNGAEQFLSRCKAYPFTITKTKPMKEAQVTAGGICTAEVDVKTMASKESDGLFLAGEMLDVDGTCGGYNLQFAFATGSIAAEGMKKYLEKLK